MNNGVNEEVKDNTLSKKSTLSMKKTLSSKNMINNQNSLQNTLKSPPEQHKKKEEEDFYHVNFSKITSKSPDNLEAFVGLAKAQFQTGDTTGAYKNLLYVRGKNPSFRKAEVDSLIAVLEN